MSNQIIIGSWITLGHFSIAEIMAKAGFDWLCVDMEHSVIDYYAAEQLIAAIDANNCVPYVRVAANDPVIIKRVLDAGAKGIIVPMINNKEDAVKVVDSVKYPPIGKRGVGLARAQGYGFEFDEYAEKVNDETIIIAQIEHIDAINNLEDILQVDGIDGTIIGPYDLSGSIGKPGKYDNPDVKVMLKRYEEISKNVGKPMGYHVIQPNHKLVLDNVYVATCDKKIANYINSIGGKAVMTAKSHERASDRTAEALLIIEEETGWKVDIVVMLQGDEPLILPEMIEDAIKPLVQDLSITVSNLMAELKTEEECKDPNEVKVVVDKNNNALYFSREPIPSIKKFDGEITAYKQVCVIPFTRDCLLEYTQLDPTPLEIIESVDMNRFLENGIKVRMVKTNHDTLAVDTKQDLENVEQKMWNDPLLKKYINA